MTKDKIIVVLCSVAIVSVALFILFRPGTGAEVGSSNLRAIKEAKTDAQLVYEWRQWEERIGLARQSGRVSDEDIATMEKNRDELTRLLGDRDVDPATFTIDEQLVEAENRDD